MDQQDRHPEWATSPGQWLGIFRCSKTPQHLLYLEERLAGPLETLEASKNPDDWIWCPWGDEGKMQRLPGEFEVIVTGALRDRVRTGASSTNA